MCSGKFFWAKTSVAFFISFENCRKQLEGSHQSASNWRENHVGIANFLPIAKSSNWIPVIHRKKKDGDWYIYI